MQETQNNDRLTDQEYWDASYKKRTGIIPVNLDERYANCSRAIFEIKNRYGLEGKEILEIGGGGSPWLSALSVKFPSSNFTCLDYSDVGIKSLKEYAEENQIPNLKVVQGDMFDTPEQYQKYDMVFSHGVVEHFTNLPEALAAHANYLKDDGVMIIIMPNMPGVLGKITKIINKPVYDIHVPYNDKDLKNAHAAAGLSIVEGGYLCSTNFGVLSSCVKRRYGLTWFIYVGLSMVSRGIWLIEDKFGNLPPSSFLSPYIYAVAKKSVGKESGARKTEGSDA